MVYTNARDVPSCVLRGEIAGLTGEGGGCLVFYLRYQTLPRLCRTY
jgi:hypothetical protein